MESQHMKVRKYNVFKNGAYNNLMVKISYSKSR